MPRKPKEKKRRGVFERESGSGIYWVRFVDVDGKRKARCVGNFSDAVNFYEAEKVRIRERILALVAGHRAVRYTQLVDEALKFSEASHRDQRSFAQRIEFTQEQFGNRVAGIHPDCNCGAWKMLNPGEQRWRLELESSSALPDEFINAIRPEIRQRALT